VAFEPIALLATGLFAGAAIYVTLVDLHTLGMV
jgi:hypothetical protein